MNEKNLQPTTSQLEALSRLAENAQELGLGYGDEDGLETWVVELSHWDKRGLELAGLVASWSKDPSTKVGCAIFSPEKTVLGVGFNGFPKNTDDSQILNMDRSRKLFRTIHAELNAINFSNGDLIGSTFYVTHCPCSGCAANIIQHKPSRVLAKLGPDSLNVDWLANMEEGVSMFNEAGIPLLFVNPRNQAYAITYSNYKRAASSRS
jgi:dCMP deaminase